jgi:hypothetical protein
MPDTRVRQQRSEFDDVFGLDKASVGEVAAGGFEDNLYVVAGQLPAPRRVVPVPEWDGTGAAHNPGELSFPRRPMISRLAWSPIGNGAASFTRFLT